MWSLYSKEMSSNTKVDDGAATKIQGKPDMGQSEMK
jgi:hypothetical protein